MSTDDQYLDLQRAALLDAGVPPRHLYEDTLSGAQADRPGLEHALRASRACDVLVVWRLDRLGRSLKDLIALAERLEEHKVGLRSLHEHIDTSTATGKLFFHLMAALAEFERNLIRERTQAGLQAARRRGKQPGRRKSLTAKDIAVATTLLQDSQALLTVQEVAERVGVSTATLYRYFSGGLGGLTSHGSMAHLDTDRLPSRDGVRVR